MQFTFVKWCDNWSIVNERHVVIVEGAYPYSPNKEVADDFNKRLAGMAKMKTVAELEKALKGWQGQLNWR
jgi:hypothetical protein